MDDSRHDHHVTFAARARRILVALFREMAPKILFFFVAFIILLGLFKCFVAQYSVTFSAFTRAAIAALVMGKVVPLLDWAQAGHRFEKHRRIGVIAVKTLIYAAVVLLLGTGERLFESARKAGSIREGIESLEARANATHFLGLVLLLSLVVGVYLTIQEIERVLGKGTLLRILLERPSGEVRKTTDPTGESARPTCDS